MTLQATALANQAWLKMVDVSSVDWRDRAHFFAVAAQMMRRILVDAARARVRDKRGGAAQRVNLEEMPDLTCRGTMSLSPLTKRFTNSRGGRAEGAGD